MAYSSAITMCGGEAMYVADNNWVSYIPLILAFLVILMITLNFRDGRTYLALFLALIGTLLVILVHQTMLVSAFYYVGTGLLILGIWVNGSLYSVLRLKNSKQAQIKS